MKKEKLNELLNTYKQRKQAVCKYGEYWYKEKDLETYYWYVGQLLAIDKIIDDLTKVLNSGR